MPVSKNKRKGGGKRGKSKVRGKSHKTQLRHLHKVHAQKRRDRVYQKIREIQADLDRDGVQEAFDEALADH